MSTAYGIGLATVTPDGTVLDTWYPSPALTEAPAEVAAEVAAEAVGLATTRLSSAEIAEALGESAAKLLGEDPERNVEVVGVKVTADLTTAPRDTYDVWLRLHLISHRLIKPHGANLDGIFGLLTNVVWTNHGPCAVEDFEQTRTRLRPRGRRAPVRGRAAVA